jgi:hypothetical protein
MNTDTNLRTQACHPEPREGSITMSACGYADGFFPSFSMTEYGRSIRVNP